jgi:catechol 2,3-dioxygenase-like lactoylglutathione lyase family enzyme
MGKIGIKSFNHTSFTVKDLDHCVRFFTEALGFTLRNRALRDPAVVSRIVAVPGAELDIAFIDGYGHTLELIQYRAPSDRGIADYRPCDVGAAHIALDVEDMETALATVEPWGFRPMGEVVAIDDGPNKGRKVVYTRSDEGIILEFIQLPR